MLEGRLKKMRVNLDDLSYSIFGKLADILLDNGKIHRATKYISRSLVVNATRKASKNGPDGRDSRAEIMFKVGSPNWKERQYIKLLAKSGEKFPVKKVKFQFYNPSLNKGGNK